MLPPRSILVAVDFSDASRDAFAFGVRLARRCESRLHVLHVEDPALVSAAGRAGCNLTGEAREELQRLIDTTPGAPSLTPARHVVIGKAADAIVLIGEREQADLIVLSSHGWSRPGVRPLGSVAQQVLFRADRSVLVLPDGWTVPSESDDIGVGPVIVGIDQSEPSARALRAACALATCLNTSVEAVHVVSDSPVPARWKGLAAEVHASEVEGMRGMLDKRLALLSPLSGPAVIDFGDVAERLAFSGTPSDSRRPLLVLGRSSARTPDSTPGAIAERVAAVALSPVLMYVDAGE